MHKVHGFACVLPTLNPPPAPALAHPEAGHAPALKAPLKRAGGAGRALRAKCIIYFSFAKGSKNHLI